MNYLDEDFDPNPFIDKESLYIKKPLDWEIEQQLFLCKSIIFSINNICTFLS